MRDKKYQVVAELQDDEDEAYYSGWLTEDDALAMLKASLQAVAVAKHESADVFDLPFADDVTLARLVGVGMLEIRAFVPVVAIATEAAEGAA